MSVVGRWWKGAGPHEGHVVTVIEVWEPTVKKKENRTVLTCGRVRCTCGTEWDVGGWPV